jgi:hypothetical protein
MRRRVLLDHNIPHFLRAYLPGHEVVTAKHRGWEHLQNGALMAACAEDGINVFITFDQSIPHQHDISQLPISIIVLVGQSSHHGNLIAAFKGILNDLPSLSLGAVTRYEIGGS